MQLLGLAREIAAAIGGDEDAESWIQRLVWLADDLGKPDVRHHPWYDDLMYRDPDLHPSRRVKLRRLIDHPDTGEHERSGRCTTSAAPTDAGRATAPTPRRTVKRVMLRGEIHRIEIDLATGDKDDGDIWEWWLGGYTVFEAWFARWFLLPS